VGRYQILEKIGEGAMAAVYKAFDPSINRPLAIKFLRENLCVDPEYRSRFLREAKAAGMLSHPNIVTVFDVGEIEGRPYIAMELVDGEPLGDVAHKGGGLPITEVVDIGIQLAKALDYAHSKGVVHRDIKPNNFLRVKGSTTIKVGDFGIAHIKTTEASEQTRFGTVLGTPNYMSPEQTMGHKVDGRSDLFSAGVVLYELLTGKRPFEGDSVVTVALRIAKEDPPPIDRVRPDVPARLRRIVERCLNKQPEKRFQSGRELADALIKVSRELAEDADEKGRPRMVPLRLK
jgi:serine/threonine-protein kinase